MNAKLRAALQAAVLVLAGTWVYSPAWHGPWLSDDSIEIANNADLRDPAGLGRIWRGTDSTDYFPLKSTVQWVEWHLWSGRTEGYHLVNLGLHLAGAFLFWWLLRELGLRWGWLGGLIFALHPQAVESVAWISELKNTLSLPLLLLAMIFYIRWSALTPARLTVAGLPRRSASWGQTAPPYQLSLLSFTLALLAKSSVVMFPAALLLYAWWKRGRIAWRDIVAAVPFAAVAFILGLATVVFQQHRAIRGVDLHLGGVSTRMAAAGVMSLFYLAKSAVPAALSFVYPRWLLVPFHAAQFLPWLVWAAGFAWLLSVGSRRDWARSVVFGLGWFLLNLVPVLGFVPMAYLRISWTADHFAYVSMLGVIGLAAAGFERWSALTPARLTVASLPRRSASWGQAAPPRTSALGSARSTSILLCLFLAWQSHRHAADFQGEERLWTATLRENPLAGTAHNNLGVWLLKQHRPAEAVPQLRRAVELDSNYPEPHDNLGEALEQTGDLPGAIVQYREALALSAAYHQAAYNLGLDLLSEGRIAESIDAYRQAIRFKPDFPAAHNNLGVSLAKLARFDEAMAEYREALREQPDYAEAEDNLGLALAKTGRLRESIAHFEAALRLNPAYGDARHNLKVALGKLGQTLGR